MTEVAAHTFDPVDPVASPSLWLERSATGDTAAFAELFDATASRVHGLVLRIVRDPRVAEEVTAAVFLEVWRRAATYDAGQGSAQSWILAIAHRSAVDRMRSSTDGRTAHPERSDVPASVVTDAMAGLPAAERHALELAYLDGCTHAEVSRRTGASSSTIATRLRTALVTLGRMAPAAG